MARVLGFLTFVMAMAVGMYLYTQQIKNTSPAGTANPAGTVNIVGVQNDFAEHRACRKGVPGREGIVRISG
jgi:hypothetical protein